MDILNFKSLPLKRFIYLLFWVAKKCMEYILNNQKT